MEAIISGVFGALIGGFIGHRLALGRDKRIEFNSAIMPLRETIIYQLQSLQNDVYERGIEEKDITKLRATLGDRATSKIVSAYEQYTASLSISGENDEYGRFLKNEDGFNQLIASTQQLLVELKIK